MPQWRFDVINHVNEWLSHWTSVSSTAASVAVSAFARKFRESAWANADQPIASNIWRPTDEVSQNVTECKTRTDVIQVQLTYVDKILTRCLQEAQNVGDAALLTRVN